VQEVIPVPGVSRATNGAASQDGPRPTEEHKAGNWQAGQRGLLNFDIQRFLNFKRLLGVYSFF